MSTLLTAQYNTCMYWDEDSIAVTTDSRLCAVRGVCDVIENSQSPIS